MRAGAVLTQLIFNHALKIRVKAETSPEAPSGNTTAVPTPDTASIADAPAPSEPTSDDANGSKKAKQQTPSVSGESTNTKVTEDPKPSGGNFLGKLNNLVTTDWNNVSSGADFLMLSMCGVIVFLTSYSLFDTVLFLPLQIVMCIAFLYTILGWRYEHWWGGLLLC